MRNVIRNILTNWRNVFGRQLVVPIIGLPYEFTAVNSSYDVKFYTGDEWAIPAIYYTLSGSATSVSTSVAPNSSYSWTIHPDVGTQVLCTEYNNSYNKIVALEIDGVMIFDNR